MPKPNQIDVNAGDNLLLVGTMKGAFLFRSDANRGSWEEAGPYFPGRSVYAFAYDGRNGRQRLWAAVNSSFWGSFLSSSNDFGKTWSDPETYNIKFPEDSDVSLKQIWQIANDPHDADALYCGVEPAALFKSADAGETWSLERGLFDHPHRTQWMPGGGGLCLHTILPDPARSDRMWIAISTGGVYRTEDGGKNWQPRNRGICARFLPPDQQYPEWGQCVHKDAGDSWQDIGKGLPSDFGFAMEIDPNNADTVFIIPIESDEFRCTPEAKLRVYRTRDGGSSWEPLTSGLPQEDAFETILRDNMKADANNPTGLYFGTRNGKLFGSTDGGDSWMMIREGLPPITCVKTATIN
ncbi:MAG: glycosyl hydrolase [Acidobacteria bacterium]|nr:MAG: glycosyl hydrolase [Acidobacteriota bacterium]